MGETHYLDTAGRSSARNASGLHSIRAKLGMLLLAATAGVGVTIGVLTLNAAKSLFLEQAVGELRNYNQALGSEIDSVTAKASNSLLMARHDTAIDRYFAAPPADPAARSTALTDIQNLLLYINKAFAIDEICFIKDDGAELARVSLGKLASDAELSRDETGNQFFSATQGLQNEAVYRSVMPYRSMDTQQLVIAHATPVVLANGRRAGVLHFEIPLQWFTEKMRTVVPPKGTAFLLAEDGSLLVAPAGTSMNIPGVSRTDQNGATRFAAASTVGTSTFRKLATSMLSAKRGKGRYFDGTQSHEVVFSPVLNGHWILATSLPEAQVLTPYYELLKTTVLVATPIAILALLIMWAYADRLVQPLRHLTAALQSLARGDLTPEIFLHRQDEVGDMSRAFRDMVGFQRQMATVANKIATGNLQSNFQPASERDILGHAFVRMIASLSRMLSDIQHAEARFRSLVQNIRDVIFILDQQGVVLYVNPAITAITGLPPEAILGKPLQAITHCDDHAKLAHALNDCVTGKRPALAELQLHRNDSDWAICEFRAEDFLDDPAVGGIIAACRDITERKEYEDRLSHQALHDNLTALANRALFQDRLQLATSRRQRRNMVLAVVLIDLDNFKTINDSLGHTCGDAMLLETARRIRGSVRSADTVARLGGDEFAVLLEDCGSVEAGIEVVERILVNMRAPTEYEGREIYLGCSIGIAFSRDQDDCIEDLLANADLAMYKAKGKGKGQYAVFDEALGQNALERMELESGLRHAIERNELEVYYQPIVQLDSEKICEVEALIRWQHPQRGQISPASFIPIAEETGLILPIGQWVLHKACSDVQYWNNKLALQPPVIVNVNLSAKQFQSPTLIEDITRTLRDTGLPPACLKLEITESMMMNDTQATVGILWKLRGLGIKLAIDDFGTGYSSLSYLKSLPIDLLKIDRSFVRGLGNNNEDNAIVQAIIAMAKALGLRVTAEGIETLEQAQELKSLHCEQGQGYLFARPGPAITVEPLLEKRITPAKPAGTASQDKTVALPKYSAA